MQYFLKTSSNLIALTLGLVFISISIAWSKKDDKYYKIIKTEQWKALLLTNINMNKSKAVLEKEVIKKILYKEELE